MLEARNVTKVFTNGFGQKSITLALDNVTLKIQHGKTTGIMGPSGCGKTTLARILLRLITPDDGSIYFNGKNITHLDGKKLLFFRKKVQYISQHPASFFNPFYTLAHSIVEPLKIFGLFNKKTINEKLLSVLEKVNVGRSLLHRYPHQVSGGEIQRLAICRALLLQPEVLILDEATSMLDVCVQAQIMNLLMRLQEQLNVTYLFISHDLELVRWISTEIVTMRNGKIL